MRLIRKMANGGSTTGSGMGTIVSGSPWKVLVIDDDEDVHALTNLNLKQFSFAGRPLELYHAYSAAEARAILSQQSDIAVALVDVVMETDDAGLRLVEYVRNELHNTAIRLIIRTGQAGIAPERHVIDSYDIDDYKDKTELTAQKLYTTLRSTLKAYRDIKVIDCNRQGLKRILDATADLYLYQPLSLNLFFEGVLKQIIGLLGLGEDGLISAVNGFVITVNGQSVVRAYSGAFAENHEDESVRLSEIERICHSAIQKGSEPEGLPPGALLLPLLHHGDTMGYVYLEGAQHLGPQDIALATVMANQCAAALANLRLHIDLQETNQHALRMLALASEYKDEDTGCHINRICGYVRALATELGFSAEETQQYCDAAQLHDIGKLGVPDAILQKPDTLTEQEFTLVKRHTLIGEQILGDHPSLLLASQVVAAHHEWWDGSGYPRGLKGEEIPFVARMVAIADVFDALAHKRPYKPAWTLEKSMATIEEESGSHFDPAVVEPFIRLYQSGTLQEIVEKYRETGARCD